MSHNNIDDNDDEMLDEGEFIDPNDIEDQIVLDADEYLEYMEQIEQEEEQQREDEQQQQDDDDDEDIPNDSIAVMNKHTESIYAIDAFQQQESILLTTGSGDDTAYVYKYNTSNNTLSDFQHLVGHKDTVMDVQFNYDGSKIATGSMDGIVGVWDVSDINNVQNEIFFDGPGESVEWIDWHPKGNLLACGSSDSTAWLWNVKTKKCLNVFAGHAGAVTRGGFTSDGKLLVTCSEDASVRIWNPVTAECVHVFQHETMFANGAITCFDTHKQEANLIITGCEDGTAALSHIGNKKVIGIIRAHEDSVESVAFSSFGSTVSVAPMIATASMDKNIHLWDVSTLTKKQTMHHEEGVVKVLFDNDQPLLYSCSVDKTVAVWDVRNGKNVRVLRGHREIVLDFVKTSSYLFTASDDGKSLVFSLLMNQ
jgi:WD40 repeat protein